MPEVFVEGWWSFKGGFVPVDSAVQVTLFNQLAEQINVRSFACPHYWAPNGNAVAFHFPENIVNDFLHGSSRYFLSACWAVRFTNSGPEETKVILYLGDGCNG